MKMVDANIYVEKTSRKNELNSGYREIKENDSCISAAWSIGSSMAEAATVTKLQLQ